MLSPLRMPRCLRDCVPLPSQDLLISYGYAEYSSVPTFSSNTEYSPYLYETLFIGIKILLTDNVPRQ